MEIGGNDLILEGSPEEWSVIFREVRLLWPDVVFEEITEEEWFAWKDQSAFQTEFPDEVMPHGFLHLLRGPQSLTIVVDADGDTECSRVGRAVLEALRALQGDASG